jgi:hypothetical protein
VLNGVNAIDGEGGVLIGVLRRGFKAIELRGKAASQGAERGGEHGWER